MSQCNGLLINNAAAPATERLHPTHLSMCAFVLRCVSLTMRHIDHVFFLVGWFVVAAAVVDVVAHSGLCILYAHVRLCTCGIGAPSHSQQSCIEIKMSAMCAHQKRSCAQCSAVNYSGRASALATHSEYYGAMHRTEIAGKHKHTNTQGCHCSWSVLAHRCLHILHKIMLWFSGALDIVTGTYKKNS